MTEEQLEKLLKRLARIQRQPAILSAYATAVPATHIAVGGGVGVQLLNANKYRWAIIIGTSSAGTVSWGFNSPNMAVSDGFVTNANSSSLIITYNEIGAAILGPLFASGSGAGVVAGWQEFQVPFPLDGTLPFQV